MLMYLIPAVAAFMASGFMFAGEGMPLISLALALIGGGLTYKAATYHKRLPLRLDRLTGANAEMLEESFAKAVGDYKAIDLALRQIKDRELAGELKLLQRRAYNLLYYLREHPERIPLAQKFIDYYQDRTALMVKKYQELESTQLNTTDVADIKNRMKTTLAGFENAYNEQFSKVISTSLMDIDAELTVMQQTMAAEGLIAPPKAGLNEPEKTPYKVDLVKHKKKSHTALEAESLDVLLGNVSQEQHLEQIPPHALRRRGRHEVSIIPEAERQAVLRYKLTAGALGIFFGTFGAHKFFLGQNGWGIAYLLLCWTFLPGLAGLVEGLRYLCMSIDEFYIQHYDNR